MSRSSAESDSLRVVRCDVAHCVVARCALCVVLWVVTLVVRCALGLQKHMLVEHKMSLQSFGQSHTICVIKNTLLVNKNGPARV